ncbi:Rrf2 family transcriptional regulator [Acetobacteraceae bacterium H6797]|nr:Rrf2 family transcriptional regulator [Acetobacteraceae bacterium H6797]
MRLSTRGRYAVMAMVEMAARQGKLDAEACCRAQPVSLSEISAAQQLSLAYLEQIFAKLRRAGLVSSARGPGGGYRLGRPAATIAVADIVSAVDENVCTIRCEDGGPGCVDGQKCRTHDLWAELDEHIRLFFTHMTLDDVVEGRVLGRALPPRRAHEGSRP